jgi:hypothetical protein
VSNGTGTFDKLMNSVNLYLNDQYNNGRLKGTDYANVLLGSIQAVLQQAVQFELQEELTEAQVGIAQKDLELKDEQILGMQKDNEVKDEQVLMSQYEREFIQPKQLEKLEEEIDLLQTQDLDVLKSTDVKERQMVEAELTGAKQRTLLETEEEIKQYEHDVLQLDQHNTNLKQQTLLEEQEKTTYTERVLKDKQAAALGLDTVVKIANVTPEAVYTPKYEEQ